MSKDSDLKIEIGDRRIVKLQELYEEYDKAHQEQADLPFEEKIKILVDLQQLASSWGRRADVIIWKI